MPEKKNNNSLKEKKLDVLMMEYTEVQKHFQFATKQKSTLLSVMVPLFGGVFIGFFTDQIDLLTMIVGTLLLAAVTAFVYGQKETEYWAAYLRLEKIENMVNHLLGEEGFMNYMSKYKRHIFPRKKVFNFVYICQFLRVLPALLLVVFAFGYENRFLSIVLAVIGGLLVILGVIYNMVARHRTNKKFPSEYPLKKTVGDQ